MLSRLQDLVTRNKKKLIIASAVIGGTFIAVKYAQRKLIQFQEQKAREAIDNSRRVAHFEATERTCNQVMIGLSSELYQALIRECSTDELLTQLRGNSGNKLQLWEEMKIVSFTRLTAFIYASSMLVVSLRVKMNILGGYLYRDIISEKMMIVDELKQQYLSLIRYFIHDEGLASLVRLIRVKVTGILKTMSLSKNITLPELEQLLWSIQMSINGDRNDPNSKMSTYVLPSQVPEYNVNGPLFQKMYNDTLDLLDCDDAASVCNGMICRGFMLAVDAIAENLEETPLSDEAKSGGDSAVSSSTSQNNNVMLNMNNVKVPLAKLIPIVSGITAEGFNSKDRPPNFATSLMTFYVVADRCKMFGANIYETFSVL